MEKPGHKGLQRSGLVEKAGQAGVNQFGNAGDRGSDDDFAATHGFHQHKGQAFAATGEHHHVGAVVEGIHLATGNVSG